MDRKSPFDQRSERGLRAYQAGQSAEDNIHRLYCDRGLSPVARRWRGGGGEIDLVFKDGDACIFVEVKQSRSLDRAAQALRPAQIDRLMRAASVYVADEPKGQMTEMRFDVALVDAAGRTEIIENALVAA